MNPPQKPTDRPTAAAFASSPVRVVVSPGSAHRCVPCPTARRVVTASPPRVEGTDAAG